MKIYDDIPGITVGTLFEDRAAARRSTTMSRIIRNTATAARVKEYHDFRCQVCGECLLTPVKPYAEAAYIRPLGTPHNGPDTPNNILHLCPNYHVLFDLGTITVKNDLVLRGVSSKPRRTDNHNIGAVYPQCHRDIHGFND